MTDLRCHKCRCMLGKDDNGLTTIKRSGLEIRAFGMESMTAICPLCAVNRTSTMTTFVRYSGALVQRTA